MLLPCFPRLSGAGAGRRPRPQRPGGLGLGRAQGAADGPAVRRGGAVFRWENDGKICMGITMAIY